MKKRVVAIASATVIALIALILIISGSRDKERSLKTSGIIDGTEVTISAKAAGRISEVCCREGSRIEKGEVLVRIEAEDLKASLLQAEATLQRVRADLIAAESGKRNAEAALRSAGADIKVSDADLESSRSRMDEAGRDLTRSDALFKEGLVSESNHDSVSTRHKTSLADVNAAKARITAAVSRKDAAAASLASAASQVNAAAARLKEAEAGIAIARSHLDDTVITSPVTGSVIFRAMEPGEHASPGAAIMTIVDLKSLFVRLDIEENKIGPVRLGGEAVITIEGMPGKALRGKVTEIGRYGEFATQRDVERGRQDIKTFRVKVRVDDPEGILKPGMTVDVEIPY
ncbi:MAG: HlyD family secretion protein [Nitrospirales bacterium]|nr:HlyD family secretion protein [Nitrospirales bacterium]